jgi:hypothetical protein
MIQVRFTGALLAALLAGQAAPAAAPAGARLGAIQMRLWYAGTGRLSENIAPPAQFTGWNTVIGEGSAREAADDVLVTVEVLAPSGTEENISVPLAISARDAKGKLLGERRIATLLTSRAGRTVQALWLRDVTCAGTVTVTAALGAARKSTHVSFDCGE